MKKIPLLLLALILAGSPASAVNEGFECNLKGIGEDNIFDEMSDWVGRTTGSIGKAIGTIISVIKEGGGEHPDYEPNEIILSMEISATTHENMGDDIGGYGSTTRIPFDIIDGVYRPTNNNLSAREITLCFSPDDCRVYVNVGTRTYPKYVLAYLKDGRYRPYDQDANGYVNDYELFAQYDGNDCTGSVGGTAYWDECNKCAGGDTGRLPCVADCAGELGGDAYFDNCGRCVGGISPLLDCTQEDCEGNRGGSARIVNGKCVGTPIPPVQDCEKVYNGTAVLDACNTCTEGTTGKKPYIIDATTPATVHPDSNGTASPVERVENTVPMQKAKAFVKRISEYPLINKQMNQLRDSAQKGGKFEHAMRVGYSVSASDNAADKYYTDRQLFTDNGTNSVAMKVTENTVMTGHNHTEYSEEKEYNYAPPSGQDVEAVIARLFETERKKEAFAGTIEDGTKQQKFLNDTTLTYKGGYVFAYNGDEYFLYVENLEEARVFRKKYGDNFFDESKGRFSDKDLQKDYKKIETEFLDKKRYGGAFSTNQAHNFALAYILKKYRSGIVLLKKEKDSDCFEEQSIEVGYNSKGKENKWTPVTKKCK